MTNQYESYSLTKLLAETQDYIISFFANHDYNKYVYHNLEHTKNVVEAGETMARHYQLNEKDFFILLASAWFHDISYYEGPQQHEHRSAMLAQHYFQSKNLENDTIETIKRTILATRFPRSPQNLIEQIICDADLFRLGMEDFKRQNKLLRQETANLDEKKITKNKWRKSTIEFLRDHHYYTDYCLRLVEPGKQKNLQQLVQKDTTLVQLDSAEDLDSSVTKTKRTVKRPQRGIETMFRISSANHQRLSDMADNKANIMITVNSIILSVVLSVLMGKIKESPHFSFPTFMSLSVNLVAIIFSVLATTPKIPGGTFTEKDIMAKKTNLLFFGNFYKMNLEEYTKGMLKMMDDSEFLYGSLIRDVYFQGITLGKKYKLLRIAYTSFMIGIIVSVLSFIIVTILQGKLW